MSPTVRVPRALRSALTGQPDARDWLAALPDLVAVACERWDLAIDLAPRAPAWHGNASLVVPVRREGEALVLKVGWPHLEARDEAVALRRWAGEGAVRLLGGDGGWTLLLERLDSTHDLQTLPVPAAIEVVGSLLRRLHVPAPPGLHLLSDDVRRSPADLPAQAAAAPGLVPPPLADAGLGALRQLASDPRDGTLLHRDLHYANVLAGRREPWLVIDPKPLSGDPAFEVAPLLWNRWDEAVATGDPAAEVRRRLEIACAAAGLDVERARAWVAVRELDNALECTGPGDATELAVHTTILGAVR
ncbi:aminoglycoside phosphotransferase family protein [Angustibacter aerolatus]